ncbi:MAG TPA: DUF1360 domain-containing protein [Motilibacteraceae bacterium]|nr:DUF1360 domain-containing protein [Motilibacteraceae bacterium]
MSRPDLARSHADHQSRTAADAGHGTTDGTSDSAPTERLRRHAAEHAAAYAHGEDRPLKGYATAMATYLGGVGTLALAGRLAGARLPERVEPWDVALISVATHRIARTLSKDAVTSPLRAPFNRYDGPSAPSELHEEVRREDPEGHALGELLSCPFCLAVWVGTAFGAGIALAPRATRLVAATFSAVAAADFLQYAYAAAQKVEKH